MVAGWARPDVTGVKVRTDIGDDIAATFVDTIDIDLVGIRIFYADLVVDRFMRATAIAYDKTGNELKTVVFQEPCTTCE